MHCSGHCNCRDQRSWRAPHQVSRLQRGLPLCTSNLSQIGYSERFPSKTWKRLGCMVCSRSHRRVKRVSHGSLASEPTAEMMGGSLELRLSTAHPTGETRILSRTNTEIRRGSRGNLAANGAFNLSGSSCPSHLDVRLRGPDLTSLKEEARELIRPMLLCKVSSDD